MPRIVNRLLQCSEYEKKQQIVHVRLSGTRDYQVTQLLKEVIAVIARQVAGRVQASLAGASQGFATYNSASGVCRPVGAVGSQSDQDDVAPPIQRQS